jgi:TonB-linked SusC/RagA family outer membrane protein
MPQSTRLRRWLTVVLAIVGVPALVFAQGATISGKITDDNQVPLVGANVTIDALNISIGSNTAGLYTITIAGARVSGQTVLMRVRAIGYTPMTRTFTVTAGASTQNFALAPDINKLSQVVVTGVTQGTEQKMLPFVVAQVSAADMPVPNSNPLAELQGKVTGANIVSASGRPGSVPAIVLRGPQSINASGRDQSPMFIVDGIEQIASASIGDINPSDIDNIEVVKGAAAASLYGARAGYGVISVTTKSGKAMGEGVRFNAHAEFGVSDIERKIPQAQNTAMLHAADGLRFCVTTPGQPSCTRSVDIYAEALRINEGGTVFALPPATLSNDCGISTPCGPVRLRGLFQVNQYPTTYDVIAQQITNGPWSNINVDMTGKLGKASFFTSIGNFRQQGSIRFLDGYRRNSIRLNVDNSLGNNWTLSMRAYYARVGQDTYGGDFFSLTRQPAFADLLRTDKYGRLFVRSNPMVQGSQNYNPDYYMSSTPARGQNDRFQGNVQARWQALSWLDGDFAIGYDRTNKINNFFFDAGTRSTDASGNNYIGGISFDNYANQSYNASMNWTVRKDLLRDLNMRFSVRGLYEAQDDNYNGQSGNNLVVPGLFTSSDLVQSASNSLGSWVTSIRRIGMFAGVDFEFKERYILNAQIRRDGSSLFGSANQWANYGRGSFAWRVAEEPFWPFKNVLNDFKLRAAIGEAGNSPNFEQQYQAFGLSNGSIQTGTLGNVNLRPELSTEVEVGIDAEILHKYGLTITHAHGIVSSELLSVPPPAATGFSAQWKNAGQLDNATWEFSLNVPLIEKRDLQYSARFNFDQTKSRITGIAPGIAPFYYSGGNSGAGAMYYVAPNVVYGAIYGRQFVEHCSQLPTSFQSQCSDAPGTNAGKNYQKSNQGLIVWTGGYNLTDGITKNLWMSSIKAGAPWGDILTWGGKISVRDSNSALITNQSIGNALPDFRYSIAQNFTFRKFTAYVLVDAVKGNSVFNIGRAWSFGDLMNHEIDQTGASVSTARPIGYYFRAAPPDNSNGVGGLYDVLNTNSFTVENASYVKIREVSLGYRIGKIGGQGDWTVSLIGRNLHTWTRYMGYDPETGGGGGNSGSAALNAIDNYGFPNTRSITFQLSSSF